MNTNSKLNRYIILLQKAPFILFIESAVSSISHPLLDVVGLSEGGLFKTIEITEKSDLRKVISATFSSPDYIAYNIIEALADALPNNAMYFPVHFFTKNDWQNYIEWKNVDTKPESQYDFTITVDKFTHNLHIVYSDYTPSNGNYDGVIHLRSLDPSVSFPLALLKECVINIHDIIVQASIGRTLTVMTESKYLSVMQTGHDSFNYINMKKVEKDLIAVLTEASIKTEE